MDGGAGSPVRAATMRATSIFTMVIMASKARLAATGLGSDNASVSWRGTICQESPQRSLHQLHWLSLPPSPTMAA